jgi:hypothetical protein
MKPLSRRKIENKEVDTGIKILSALMKTLKNSKVILFKDMWQNGMKKKELSQRNFATLEGAMKLENHQSVKKPKEKKCSLK